MCMKMFRFLMMMMAAVVMAGFVSCNDDAEDIGGGDLNTEEANAYLSFNIMVSDDSGLRGAEDSGTPEPASLQENKISNLYLYFFKENSGVYEYVTGVTVPEASLTSTGTGASSGSIGVRFPETPGTYQVIALANKDIPAPPSSGDNMEDVLKSINPAMAYVDQALGSTDVLPMASRTKNNLDNPTADIKYHKSQPYTEFTITASNNKDNPLAIKITMERAVAKLAIKAVADNEYTINSTLDNECVVTIDGYSVVNVRNSGYFFRNVVQQNFTVGYGDVYDGPQANTGGLDPKPAYQTSVNPNFYVWDPMSVNKNSALNAIAGWTNGNYLDDYHQHVTGITFSATTPGIFENMITSSTYSLVGYCAENTAVHDAQRNGYSTGVVFRGSVNPTKVYEDATTSNPYASGTDVYYSTRTKKFYEDADAVVADPDTRITLVDIATFEIDEAGLERMELTAGLQKFTAGHCYYTYWIKHQDDDLVKNQIMEFAIVRNNVYNMAITEISKLGSSDVFIDPKDPNESSDLYFKVDLEIRPWIVRENNIKF